MNRVASDVAAPSADLIEHEAGAGPPPLGPEIIEEWRRYLLVHEGACKTHADKSVAAVKDLFATTGWTSFDEIAVGPAIEWVTKLLESKLNRKTVANRTSCVRMFGRWAHLVGYSSHNPLASLRQPRVRGVDRGKGARAFTLDEIRRLIEAAEEAERRRRIEQHWMTDYGMSRSTLYRFLAFSMLRISEAFDQVWADIDLDAGRMTVTMDKSRRNDEIPLHPELVEALRRLRAWQEESGRAPSGGRVFFKTCHSTLHADMARAGVSRTVGGKPGGAWHRFRKAGVTARLAAGQDAEIVRRLARHSSVQMTQTIYNDLHDDSMTAACNDFSLNGGGVVLAAELAAPAQPAVATAEPYAPAGPLRIAGWIEFLDGRAGALVVDEQGREHVVRLLGEITYSDGAKGWVVADGQGREHTVRGVAPGGDRPRGVLMGEGQTAAAGAEMTGDLGSEPATTEQ